MIGFSSCAKDPVLKKDNMSAMTKSRSASGCGDCDNLISNGDFTDHNITNIPDGCISNFVNNLVDEWSPAFGTPDLRIDECCDLSNQCSIHDNYAGMVFAPVNQYTEGILHDVDMITDEDVVYNFCFEGMGNIKLKIVLTSSFTPTTNTTYNYPSFGNHQVIFHDGLNITYNPCCEEFDDYSFEFAAARPYQQLILYPFDEGSGGVYVDNISLSCRSTYLEGILYRYNGCEFTFEPKLSGHIDVDEYHWDFGDSNTSNDENPTHEYEKKDEYIVTLTIIDTRGCCSTVTTKVECKDVAECLSYLCWEFVPVIECAHSVTLQLPGNNNAIVVPFIVINNATNICSDPYFQNPIPASIDITGGFCEIAVQIINAIETLGYDVDFEESNAMFPCLKGSTPIPGFFFTSQVKVIALNGDDCNSGPSYSVPFDHEGCVN